MKTRVGKIAQLPKPIRDELNQRLDNGQQGPELLKWLNALPETKELLTAKFDNQPINRQNLTEWRHGGHEDWLRHQAREHRIQRVTEEGTALRKREDIRETDVFENSARIALAELMADLDSVCELQGEERWNRLRSLIRELTRLQLAYNRSRWTDLVWTKWNDRFLGPAEDKTQNLATEEPATNSIQPEPIIVPLVAQVSQPAVSPISNRQPATIAERPEPPAYVSNLKSEISNPPTLDLDAKFKPNQTTSTGAPACSRLTASKNPEASFPPTAPASPFRPSSPVSPPPPTDFSRRMALLKSHSQIP